MRTRLAALALAALSCTQQPSLRAPHTLEGSGESVRAHLRDGRVYALEAWRREGETLHGTGALYDVERRLVRRGAVTLPLADVAIIEMSERQLRATDAAIAALAVVSVASAVGTVACAASPKSCFGSCPTFYVQREGAWTVQAEGFSTSVARSLEADDLDDLPEAAAERGELVVAMRNEALETHVTRRVALRVVDAPAGSTAYRRFESERFDALGPAAAPAGCDDAAVCRSLAARDGDEYAPAGDGADLAGRATLTLRYPPPGQPRVALALTARNSLMNTFVFYHLLALHGREAPAFNAALERLDPVTAGALTGFDRALGGVDVAVRDPDGAWRPVATLPYIGPIARATRAAAFTVRDPSVPVEVRLRFARAHWRLDAATLGPVVASDLAAATVWPSRIDGHAGDDDALATRLQGGGAPVVTQPGDELFLRFRVPPTRGAATYFLSARGYYHEWLREAWLRDEDLPLARAYLEDPPRALRELAPAWERVAPDMARVFEASRFRGR